MATADYLEKLNDYQSHLADVASVVSHLLDLVIDLQVPEWQTSLCAMMRDELASIADRLPFPAQPGGDDLISAGAAAQLES